jgi:hypothetical protein
MTLANITLAAWIVAGVSLAVYILSGRARILTACTLIIASALLIAVLALHFFGGK